MERLGLTTLEERRIRGDLIETYKIVTGKENVNREKFFHIIPPRGNPELRHDKKIFKKRCQTEVRKHFFTQRVIDNWNGRSKEVIESEKTGTFKKRLDRENRERRQDRNNQIYAYRNLAGRLVL